MRDTVLQENVDYELIPQADNNWQIRFLETDYPETVIEFTVIKLIEDGLSFDFKLISSPNNDLTVEDFGLQKAAGDVLYSILDNSFKEYQENNEH